MNDQDKTKEELVNELVEIRQRVAELEGSLVTLTQRVEAGREAEAISRAMIEGFPGLVYLCSPSHGIEFINERFIRLTGYNPRGEKYYQVLYDLEGISPRHVNEKVQHGETVRSEVQSPKDNRWYHVVNIPLRHQNDAISKMVMIEDITERKQAEAAVRRSEERLELALKGADLGMWDYNLQTGEAVVNARRAEMVGYSVEELGSHFSSWGKLIHPDDIDRITNAFNAHVEGRARLYESEHRLRHKSGRYIWVLARGKVVKWDKQGNPVRMVGTSLDITDGRRADKALSEGRQRLELALEGARVGFWDWDALTDTAVINDRAANIVGYSLREITPTSQLWESLIHTDDKPRVAEVYNAHLKGHTDYFEAEYRMLAKSGEWKWILSLGKIVERDQEMRPLRMAGTFMDITDLKRAENALRESERRYRLLIEQSPLGIGILQDGGLTYVNPALLGIFGYDHPDEVLSKPPENFIAPEDRELISKIRKDRLDGKALPVSYEVKGLKSNGDRFDLAVWPRRIDYLGEPAILAFIADRTEAKQLRMQLVQAQKMEAIGTLAGGIAHDLNNLLTIILGYSELFISGKAVKDPDFEDLTKIVLAARTAAEVSGQILAFSRKTETKTCPFNLNERVDRLRRMLSRFIPKTMEFTVNFDPDLPTINADPAQIDQVLMNLALNARDAMPEGGRLAIETKRMVLDDEYCRYHIEASEGLHALITVSDTGIGIDSASMERIFEPFYTTKKPGEGTGLGLAMVYGIVKAHGGHIICDSEPGVGTTFKIYLPVHQIEAEPDVPSGRQSSACVTETILLVDDEQPVRELGSRILGKSGYDVISACDGREALEIYRQRKDEIALIILDLVMPLMDGKRCLAEILGIDPEARVLIATGYSPDGATRESLEGYAKGFVEKPFDSKQFLNAVRNALNEP